MLVSLLCFHFISTTHDCYDRTSLPIHTRWALVRPRTASREQDVRYLQVIVAVLRPESDGEQGSIVGKPSERHVLPSISLQASATRVWSMRQWVLMGNRDHKICPLEYPGFLETGISSRGLLFQGVGISVTMQYCLGYLCLE